MAPQIPNFTPIWSDGFQGADGALPDETKWHIKAQEPNAGNAEVQRYRRDPANVALRGNELQIQPQRDGPANGNGSGGWTSGQIEGKAAFACPAGRQLLLQAQLRTGTAPASRQAGVWPAFWALGQDMRERGVDWPRCGEWDILEAAHGADWTIASVHFAAGDGGSSEASGENKSGGGVHQERGGATSPGARKTFTPGAYHTWSLRVDRSAAPDWRAEALEWALDGEPFFRVRGADVGDADAWDRVAHRAFFPVLNVAVGSNFPGGGQPDADTATGLGSGLQVRYVGFYLKD